MAQYMLLLHQAPNYNMDLPREKMMEMTKRYMAWADGLRQKGKIAGGEKLAASGGRHIKVKDGKPVASDGPYAEAKDVIGGYFVIEAKDLAEADHRRPLLVAHLEQALADHAAPVDDEHGVVRQRLEKGSAAPSMASVDGRAARRSRTRRPRRCAARSA